MSSLTVNTEPSTEPVSTADMKTFLRVDTSADDTLIAGLVKAARRHCEQYQNRAYITQTLEYRMDEFKDEILLPKPPLQSVSSIKYTDSGGNEQTLDSSKYTVDKYYAPARIVQAFGQSYPTLRDTINTVIITYVAGYGDAASDVHEEVIQAIKMLVAHWYEHREAVSFEKPTELPMGVKALLDMESRNWLCR